MGDDVGRKIVESHSRKLARELVTQSPHVVRGAMMFLFQGDQNVCIGRTREPGVVVDVVDIADRQANIVEDIVDFGRGNRLSDTSLYQIG